MQEPLVTVGITAYREGVLLKRAWESILNQTNSSWNAVIALDGNSDDETKAIFESINHPRLTKYESDVNIGSYLTRSKALEITHTEWFYYLDGDDAIPNNAIDIFYNSISDEYSFWGGFVKLTMPNKSCKIHNCENFDINSMIYDNFCPAIVAFKKTAFSSIGGYSKQLIRGRADFDLLLSIYESGLKYLIVKEIIYEYIQRDNSLSKSYKDAGFRHLVIVKRHPTFFKDSKIRNYFLTIALESSFLHYFKGKQYKLAHLNKIRIMQNLELSGYLKIILKLPDIFTFYILTFRNFYRNNASKYFKKVFS